MTGVKANEFFGSLESLRGLAAFAVVLYHLPPWHDAFFRIPFVRHGHLMVDFFFVLSGFVLFHSYGKRIATRGDFTLFVALRLGRLYPIHLLFMLPFLLIELGKYFGGNAAHGASSLGAIATTLTANLTLTQGLGFNDNKPAFNFPNWSISTEFYTYLIFASVLLIARARFLLCAAALVAVTLGVLVFFGPGLGDFSNILRCIAGFFIGCLTRAAYEPLRGRALKRDWPLLAVGLPVLLLSLDWGEHGSSAWEYLSLPISAILVVVLLLTPSSRVNTALLSRPLRWLGEISYSLYMAHALVQWCARHLCRVVLQTPEVIVDGYSTSRLTTLQALVAYPLVTLLTLVVARLAYVWVEAPARELSKRTVPLWFAARQTAS